ncbi:MAG: hypothetical protein GXO10_05755 [Crenarchaeota archaeon]|nr:hypothetical protein [Thermoproteota archaeon]
MPNIYMGRDSCYARYEKMYVSSGPMDLRRAAAHLYLHLRDLERGWTYDHECRRIRMDEELFKARSRYLVKICYEQVKDEKECEKVRELVEYVIARKRLPTWAQELAESAIVKVSTIEDFFK